MESKELIIKEEIKYGYIVLAFVFIASIIGSIVYFTNVKGKESQLRVISKRSENVYFVSGESGELIFISKNAKKNEENQKKEETDTKLVTSNIGESSINTDANVSDEKQEDNMEANTQENVLNGENSNLFASKRKLDKNKPMVALTFDDGPDPKRTLEIIEILKKYNVRASFFDIGNLMEKYPDTLRAEVMSGSDVGGHTYSHTNLNNLSKEEIEEEISKMEEVFRNATGQVLKYVRPTYGNANDLVKATVKHPLINWCVDSLDWKSRDTDKILEEIYQTDDFDGKIIIMHVIYDSTVEAVKKLVPDLIQKGYQLVTISEMAEYKNVILENGKVYYQF